MTGMSIPENGGRRNQAVRRIRWVFFDAFGTLFDYDGIFERAAALVHRREKMTVPFDDFCDKWSEVRAYPNNRAGARRAVLASRSRSEEAGVSKATRQGRATPRCDATTRGPEGWGGERPSAALQLLDVSRWIRHRRRALHTVSRRSQRAPSCYWDRL